MRLPQAPGPSRILVTSLPFVSHLLAQLPLALALAGAGHEVRIATSDSGGARQTGQIGVAGLARGAGLDVIPVPMHPGDPSPDALVLPEHGAPWRRFGYLPHAARVAPALLRAFERWCPDVVVRDPLEVGSCLAAERAGIPHAVGREGPFWTAATRRDDLGADLDDLRRQLGLPADPAADMLYRYLGFVFAPPDLLGPDAEVAPVQHFIRPAPFDALGQPSLPDQPDEPGAAGWQPPPSGRTLVYATLGTVFNSRSDVLQSMAAALAGEAYDALVTIGPGGDLGRFAWARPPAGPGPGVRNLTVRRYVPQSSVLPHTAVLVAHGGFHTVVGALLHGVPQVLLPIGGDQHRNAGWCQERGAALVLDEDDRSPRAIRQAVRTVLADPSYREAAVELQRATAALPDMAHAVRLVERLAAERVPLPRTTPSQA